MGKRRKKEMKFKVFYDFTLVDPNTSCFTGKSGHAIVTTSKIGVPIEELLTDQELRSFVAGTIDKRYKRKKVFDLKITKIEEKN